ncbi:MAG: DUF6319 family protein [Gordonia sp. (in: high G+C Gram-positive bacteria)]|uniref:DUF6319 family protein n=1 Tax=Gordonia sp. (in: high G+C Gram-positive bacteria) TaxID=84139 RepID=UPI0039E5CC96
MASRRRPAAHLTAEELETLAAAVAEGRRATVYLREAVPSLNLDAGASARVVSVSGGTVTVKPRGIDDELPYEADELRLSKNPPPEPSARPAAKRKSAPFDRLKEREQATEQEQTSKRNTAKEQGEREQPAASAKPQARRPSAARKTTSPAKSVTVTVYGSTDNQWTVAVTRGANKPPRSRPVSPEAVEAAVADLGDEIASDAVTSVLHAAREQAQRRVEELSAELEAAKRALAELDGR